MHKCYCVSLSSCLIFNFACAAIIVDNVKTEKGAILTLNSKHFVRFF